MFEYTLSESTLRILKNFASIGGSVILKPGTTQKTMNAAKSMVAIAEFVEPWPKETPVFMLSELLANISAYGKPVLGLDEKQFIIRGADSVSHVEYPYSDASVVMGVPDRTFDTSNEWAPFTLPASAVAEIKKFSAINNLPVITIVLNGAKGTIEVKPMDDKNPSSRSYFYPVHADAKNIADGAIKSLGTHTVKFKTEHFDVLLDGAYEVKVGEWPYVSFRHQSEPVSYIIVQKSN